MLAALLSLSGVYAAGGAQNCSFVYTRIVDAYRSPNISSHYDIPAVTPPLDSTSNTPAAASTNNTWQVISALAQTTDPYGISHGPELDHATRDPAITQYRQHWLSVTLHSTFPPTKMTKTVQMAIAAV